MLKAASSWLTSPDGHGRGALVAYGALAAADLVATHRSPRGPARAAKPLLMPALATHVLRRRGGHEQSDVLAQEAPKPLLAGLACATVGDTALLFDERESAFLLGMAAFLGTQVSYTAGFVQLGAVACLAVWAGANAVLQPGLERRLRLPIAGYSLALAVMGAAALGVGGKVGAGALSFLGSDALIGLKAAGHTFPSQEELIMAGYLAGQYLITSGWLEQR